MIPSFSVLFLLIESDLVFFFIESIDLWRKEVIEFTFNSLFMSVFFPTDHDLIYLHPQSLTNSFLNWLSNFNQSPLF